MKPLHLLLMFLLTVGFITTGCKEPPPPPRPTPTHTHTPTPDSDLIAFTQGGRLMAVAWAGTGLRVIYSHPSKSVWFPAAANANAQSIVGPDGKSGPHYLGWLSDPSDGSQNIARFYPDGSVSMVTTIEDRARPEMKRISLGNAPAYSHDGKRVAYSHNGNIWIMDSDGYNAVTLISDNSSWSPSWSHDDKHIVYVNIFEGSANVWVTNVDDMDTYQVTDFSEYSAGSPIFGPQDKRILLTRIQKDESDVVTVLAHPDTPLVDSEPVTTDHQSAGGIYGPDERKVVFSSSREDQKDTAIKDPFAWNLWRSDLNGQRAVRLSEATGTSPAWLRPVTAVAAVGLINPPKITEEPAEPVELAAKPTAPAVKPAKPTKPEIEDIRPKPILPKPQATPKPIPTARPVEVAKPVKPIPAPTQPAVAAAALKLRVSVGFDTQSDELDLSSLPAIQRISGRLHQYPEDKIRVYGPLDTSELKGRYPSNEARSKARAQKVAHVIASSLGIDANMIKSIPYVPQALGDGSSKMINGVQLYVQIK